MSLYGVGPQLTWIPVKIGAAAAAIDQDLLLFPDDQAMTLSAVKWSVDVNGTGTLMLRKHTGTAAPATADNGTTVLDVLASAIDFSGAARTSNAATLRTGALGPSARRFLPTNRLVADFTAPVGYTNLLIMLGFELVA